MNISFDKSFTKSLDKLKDQSVARSLEDIITSLQQARSLSQIKNVKKLHGFKRFYRIRIGDYRLGFELETPQSVRLIVLALRKDIYKKFP